MAKIEIEGIPGGRLVKDVARERLKNLKTTGGLPSKKMTSPPVHTGGQAYGSKLSNDAKNIQIRQQYEDMPEGLKRPGGRR